MMVAGLGLTAGSAMAGPTYTTVRNAPGSELGHAAIMQGVFGSVWNTTGATNLDLAGAGRTARRVSDGGIGSMLALGTSTHETADDCEFSGGLADITVHAKQAGDNSEFGWYDDTQATPVFQPLVNTGAIGTTVRVMLSSHFRFGLHDISTGKYFSSRPTDNAGLGSAAAQTFDQLTTYQVSGAGTNSWMLFWEDRISGQPADYDYNDSVISVQMVPAPGVGALAGLGMFTVAGRRRRR